LDVKDFDREVIEASRETPVLVDFWAPWCGPCRILGPVLEKLAAEANGRWKLAKVNTDENPAVAARYRISSIPAVKLFVDGRVTGEFVGALPEQRVRQWLDDVLPSENRARLEQAEPALARGDEAEAESLANLVLVEEPANADASLILARALLFRNPARARELARQAAAAKPGLYQVAQSVESIANLVLDASDGMSLPEGPGREAFSSAVRALAARDLDAAASGFIESLRRDRHYNDEAARRAGIALFNLLGDAHPVTQKYRRAFEMAVF
jgi:putative thioredoxin